jgi:hypothetical protein
MLRSMEKPKQNALFRLLTRIPLLREVRQIRQEIRELRAELQEERTARTVQFLDFQLGDHPRYGDPRRLLAHAFQVNSQNGEDGMIREIFRRIGTTDRIFAEVGIGDGRENNTAFLLAQDWSGFWIDGDDAFVKKIEQRRDLPADGLKSRVAFVTRENIAALFREMGVPREFDLLSLDIDQNTYYAWEGLADFRPRVVVVEYNAALPADLDWKVRYDPEKVCDRTINTGASLKAFENLGRRFGYSLVGCDIIGVNAFFVRSDLTGGKFVEPFTAENHHEPIRTSLLHRRNGRLNFLDRPA